MYSTPPQRRRNVMDDFEEDYNRVIQLGQEMLQNLQVERRTNTTQEKVSECAHQQSEGKNNPNPEQRRYKKRDRAVVLQGTFQNYDSPLMPEKQERRPLQERTQLANLCNRPQRYLQFGMGDNYTKIGNPKLGVDVLTTYLKCNHCDEVIIEQNPVVCCGCNRWVVSRRCVNKTGRFVVETKPTQNTQEQTEVRWLCQTCVELMDESQTNPTLQYMRIKEEMKEMRQMCEQMRIISSQSQSSSSQNRHSWSRENHSQQSWRVHSQGQQSWSQQSQSQNCIYPQQFET